LEPEGEEYVSINTISQQGKRSSQKKSSTKSDSITNKILNNAWWPFDRVDGKLLEKIHRKHFNTTAEQAPF
jgi:hypothetical protein